MNYKGSEAVYDIFPLATGKPDDLPAILSYLYKRELLPKYMRRSSLVNGKLLVSYSRSLITSFTNQLCTS